MQSIIVELVKSFTNLLGSLSVRAQKALGPMVAGGVAASLDNLPSSITFLARCHSVFVLSVVPPYHYTLCIRIMLLLSNHFILTHMDESDVLDVLVV